MRSLRFALIASLLVGCGPREMPRDAVKFEAPPSEIPVAREPMNPIIKYGADKAGESIGRTVGEAAGRAAARAAGRAILRHMFDGK